MGQRAPVRGDGVPGVIDIAWHYMRVESGGHWERIQAVVDIGDGTVGKARVLAIRVVDEGRNEPITWALTDKQIGQYCKLVEGDIRRRGHLRPAHELRRARAAA